MKSEIDEVVNPAPRVEVPLKQWCAEEALRLGITPNGVYERMRRGKYPAIAVRRVNKRVVLVQVGTWCQRLLLAAWFIEQAETELGAVPDTEAVRNELAAARERITKRTERKA